MCFIRTRPVLTNLTAENNQSKIWIRIRNISLKTRQFIQKLTKYSSATKFSSTYMV